MSLSRNLMFHQRLKELEEFKAEFGHRNVPGPTITNKYNSLAGWSYQMRGSYKAFEEGRKSPCTSMRQIHEMDENEPSLVRLDCAIFDKRNTINSI